MEGRHLDGVETHNFLSNLEWSTRSRNGQDKKWHKGARTYVMSVADARLCKQLILGGARGVDLAARFGVAQSTISAIRHGRFHTDV